MPVLDHHLGQCPGQAGHIYQMDQVFLFLPHDFVHIGPLFVLSRALTMAAGRSDCQGSLRGEVPRLSMMVMTRPRMEFSVVR